MYMNQKPNKHNRISFNITTKASLGFIAPSPKFNFLLRSPQLFLSEIFRSPQKLGGPATMPILLKKAFLV